MASHRYPPPTNSDLRLPSIKDLNFYPPSRPSSSWPDNTQRIHQPRHDAPHLSNKRDSEDIHQRTDNAPSSSSSTAQSQHDPQPSVPTYAPPYSYHPHEQQQQQQPHYSYYSHPQQQQQQQTQQQQQQPQGQQQQQQQQQPRPLPPPRPAYQSDHSQQYTQSYFTRPHPPPPPPPAHAQPVQPPPPPPSNPAPAVFQPHYTSHQQAPPQYHPPPPVPYPRSSPGDVKSTSHHDSRVSDLLSHCTLLYDFARRYASSPHLQPTSDERAAMQRKSDTVLTLLTQIREATFASPPSSNASTTTLKPDHQFILQDGRRPPKRPWEDMATAHEHHDQRPPSQSPSSSSTAVVAAAAATHQDPMKLAERDMELIRSKRATTAAQANGTSADPNNSKTKYRKRSRASPPGKCHSCNIRETPEWRRGPDGARTLCNACGLHYAKLMRKRDKANGGGDSTISIDSVRASVMHESQSQDHLKDAPSPATSSSSLPVVTHSSNNTNLAHPTSPSFDSIPPYRTSPPTSSTTTHSTYSTPSDPPFNSSAQSFMRHSR